MKKLVFLIIFILIFPSIGRAEEILLTLDESIAIALRDNHDILLKTEDIKKAQAKVKESQAGLLPTLNFTMSQSAIEGLYDKRSDQTATQTSVKQYLYKGGKTMNTIDYNKNKLEVTDAILFKTKSEIILNVKKAFYTLLLTAEYADLNKRILNNTQKHLETIEARYQSGQVSESDVLKMKESLKTVEEAFTASLNQVEAAQSLLRNLLFLEEEVAIIPDDEFIYEPKEIAYDEGFLEAVQSRPEIRQYEAQEKADKNSIEMAKADNRPNIFASWDYYSRSHLATGVKNWNDYQVFGLTFTWPIFDGWATKAKIEQAIVDLKETQLTKEKIIKDIALELKKAYLSLKNAIAQVKAAEADIIFYQNNVSNIEKKYNKGIASFLDLDDAALSEQVSRFNQDQAIYNYLVAKSEFEKATGGL